MIGPITPCAHVGKAHQIGKRYRAHVAVGSRPLGRLGRTGWDLADEILTASAYAWQSGTKLRGLYGWMHTML